VQKPAQKSIAAYYDKEYRISLESDDFDQLYDKVDNTYVYRTDYQAELVLNSVKIPFGAKVLDYGAGKAATLMKMLAIRSDIIPYAFDVSDNYKKHWQSLSLEQQATYKIPETWKHKFSLIMAHFVLEHVADPVFFLKNTAQLLEKDGCIFFTVPDLLANVGDLIAVDHINHFSIKSINTLLGKAGLSIIKIERSVFRGALVCVAKRYGKASLAENDDPADFADNICDIVRLWLNYDVRLSETIKQYKSAPSAIFGAGVYGSYIATKIKGRVPLKCFLDNSLHLIKSKHMGFPVISPSDIPEDISVIYSGLNPSIARGVLEPLKTERISKIIFFDEGVLGND
jgi:hypothetical protein